MIRKSIFLLLAVFTIAAVAGDNPKAETQKPCCQEKVSECTAENMQTLCPVQNKAINQDVFMDIEGSRVYFCCDACKEAFSKDPDAYLKKMSEAGVTLHKAPCTGEACKDNCKDGCGNGCGDDGNCKGHGNKATDKT